MSNYIKLTENEILPVTGDVTDVELEVLKEKVLLQMEQELLGHSSRMLKP